MVNSSGLNRAIMQIHQRIGQDDLEVCVQLYGAQTHTMQPIKQIAFDDHHRKIVLIIDDPENTISL